MSRLGRGAAAILLRMGIDAVPALDDEVRDRLGRRYGIEIDSWLEGVPPLLSDLAERWQLAQLALVRRGTVSLVVSCRRSDGRPAVLKVSPDVARINSTLKSIDQTTSTLAAERDDLRTLIREAAAASKQLNQTLAGANQLVNGPGRQTLDRAAAAMASLQKTTQTLNELLTENQGSLQSGLRGVDQIGPALRELRSTLRDIHQITSQLQANPAGYLLGRDHATEFTPKH